MKITFSHRIIGAFLTIAVLLIFVGYFAFVTTNNLQKVSRAIMKENVSSLKAAEELEIALLNQKGLVSSYFMDSNPSWLKILEDKKKDFDAWFKKAQDSALTDNEKRILQDVISLYRTYDKQRNKAIRLYQSGNSSEAKNILLNDMRKNIDYVYQKCEDLILANESLIAQAEASSQGNVFRMTTLIWATIIITLLLGSFMGFFIARKINAQLVRSAKMASLGQLSANIAHEIRNPLTSIKMRLYSLEEELKNSSSTNDDMNVITEEINRMEKTVKNFLDFARPPEPNLEKCDIIQILEGTVSLVSLKAKSQNIQIKKKFNVASCELKADKEQMRQVFLNIMLNSIEAMPEGGVLEILTERNQDTGSSGILEIQIRDTGPGISSDVKNKLFEPFFTTKAEGTGLGLFIASRITQMHKGKLEIKNQLEKGAVLTLKLPIG